MKQPNNPSYKVVFFDVETCPNLSWTWGKYEQNVIAFQNEWYLLSFSYKVQGDKKAHTFGLDDFPLYKTDPCNDRDLVKKLWEVLDSADVVIGHNSDAFDLKKARARFIYHGLPPPSPFKTVDTLKLARKFFSFNSNKLGDLSDHLGLGAKVETGGFKLWLGCMSGDPKSWFLMKKYNEKDVVLLEKVYDKLKPWHITHPRMSPYPDCHMCGSKVQRRGPAASRTKGQQYRFQCTNPKCAVWTTRVDSP